MRQQFGEPRLAPRAEIVAVEMQQIEHEEHPRRGVAAGRCELDHVMAEVDAVSAHAHSSPSR